MPNLEKSLILFHAPDFGLDEARAALTERGLTVSLENDLLLVQWGDDSPIFRISLARGVAVQKEITGLSESIGDAAVSALAGFDARFEIAFDDLDDVLDEINTLIEIQITLQNATRGYLYNTWNRHFAAPND